GWHHAAQSAEQSVPQRHSAILGRVARTAIGSGPGLSRQGISDAEFVESAVERYHPTLSSRKSVPRSGNDRRTRPRDAVHLLCQRTRSEVPVARFEAGAVGAEPVLWNRERWHLLVSDRQPRAIIAPLPAVH